MIVIFLTLVLVLGLLLTVIVMRRVGSFHGRAIEHYELMLMELGVIRKTEEQNGENGNGNLGVNGS